VKRESSGLRKMKYHKRRRICIQRWRKGIRKWRTPTWGWAMQYDTIQKLKLCSYFWSWLQVVKCQRDFLTGT